MIAVRLRFLSLAGTRLTSLYDEGRRTGPWPVTLLERSELNGATRPPVIFPSDDCLPLEGLMPLQRKKLVTIVAEAILESKLKTLVVDAGATGYTVTPATGWGKHGTRSSGIDSDGNIVMTVLTGEEVAAKILKEIERNLIKHYGIMAYQVDAEVL